jgi:surface antigen
LLYIVFAFCFRGKDPRIGDVIDSLDGVSVFYNGKNFTHTAGRNFSDDGYNFGLKYQCVEFVKRYYYYQYGHKMPNAGGNAKDYFDNALGDVGYNKKRGLTQYRNVRYEPPRKGDLLVYGATDGNPYGHVAIIGNVGRDSVEIVQQNWGMLSRKKIKIARFQDIITVADYHILGWLRKN